MARMIIQFILRLFLFYLFYRFVRGLLSFYRGVGLMKKEADRQQRKAENQASAQRGEVFEAEYRVVKDD